VRNAGQVLKLLAAFALTVAPAAYESQPALQRLEAVEPHMGTLVKVTVYTATEQDARAAFRAAFERIHELDDTLSDYQPDSELSRLTHRAVGHGVRVSDDLFNVLRASQQLAKETNGAFDVTQGPVTRLWREARKTGHPPDPGALTEASARSGFEKLHVDAANHTVRCDTPGMILDVGAIGKGYAASEALAAITKRGVRRALVAVSGDLAFSEAPPGQRGWRIRVHDEDPVVAGVPATLELANAAVSTSGNREQHLDVGTTRYSHVIDPALATGLVNDITVTVVAPHGIEADGLDTAAGVLGAARGLALIESHRAAAGFIVEKRNGSVVVSASSRFRQLVDARD
jgi:thiamine biosynthesis lipoprotein